MGMFEKSIEECKKAISLSPSVAAAHTNLGIVYMNINRYEAAAEEFVKAIDIDPDSATAHYYLGLAYGRTGRQEEGEGELKKAARLKVRPKRRAKKE